MEMEYVKLLMEKIVIRALMTVTLKQRVIPASNIAVVMEEFAEATSVITMFIPVRKSHRNLTAVEI